ncbi:MAG TPA: aminopeptidase, partial [Rhodopirellula sp.]|nr:aminopeptidase [Rhodopirellula sp.]
MTFAPCLNRFLLLVVTLILAANLSPTACRAQHLPNPKHTDSLDRFFQIESWLPTPNAQRTASGVPGPAYWQQRADYDIDITLDDKTQRLSGISRIKYHNKSPHTLRYIWVQLDQNRFKPDSDSATTTTAPSLSPRISFRGLNSILARTVFEGGYKIESVTDEKQTALPHTIIKTMMRIDLPEPLKPGMSTGFEIRFSHNIINAKVIRARGGYEFFEEDENYIYEIAQWFPRVVSYTDYKGWQHKQFLGRGEFTLELGDYVVRITTPSDMVVAATGELQNTKEVLKPEWIKRLQEAESSKKPLFIVTPEEAKQNESEKSNKPKTWIYSAKNVRDFAFAASRKFIWDAMAVKVGNKTPLAMSYYPKEGNPLWEQYSTKAVAQTLKTYSKHTIDYPYPVAISVNAKSIGMEYPMICFNYGRCEDDGTYSERTKYGMIGVIIHEVGHNFFPMIINSDERQWTWMDEGLNTFVQFLTEKEFDRDYPSRRGSARNIRDYMGGDKTRISPIMTNSESIYQFGNNAYGKPATALNILRETVMGRELFDH